MTLAELGWLPCLDFSAKAPQELTAEVVMEQSACSKPSSTAVPHPCGGERLRSKHSGGGDNVNVSLGIHEKCPKVKQTKHIYTKFKTTPRHKTPTHVTALKQETVSVN